MSGRRLVLHTTDTTLMRRTPEAADDLDRITPLRPYPPRRLAAAAAPIDLAPRTRSGLAGRALHLPIGTTAPRVDARPCPRAEAPGARAAAAPDARRPSPVHAGSSPLPRAGCCCRARSTGRSRSRCVVAARVELRAVGREATSLADEPCRGARFVGGDPRRLLALDGKRPSVRPPSSTPRSWRPCRGIDTTRRSVSGSGVRLRCAATGCS